ncbi:MAG: pyridoxine 5'-phosphate synthase, partial [Bacteroidota bacterium]
ESDVRRLRQTIKSKLDLEMAAVEEIVRFAMEVVPDLVTLVPERREELTTEGGLDVRAHLPLIADVAKQLHEKKIHVSLFVDPVPDQVEAAKASGSDKIEIHTGEYANAQSEDEQRRHLQHIRQIAELGKRLGLGVNAGHGLTYDNVLPIVRISSIDEISIGHAIVTRAVFVGMDRAVREMVQLVKSH